MILRRFLRLVDEKTERESAMGGQGLFSCGFACGKDEVVIRYVSRDDLVVPDGELLSRRTYGPGQNFRYSQRNIVRISLPEREDVVLPSSG